jgi:TRAP-type mannitol/chloroaromatic compound transport system substrate-binding protein
MHPVKSTSPTNLWAVNLDTWNKLPDDLKATVERAAKDAHLRSLTWGVMEDFMCLKTAIEEKGSEIMFLPEEVAFAVDKAAAELYHKKAKKNEDIARVLESWAKFKKDYGKYGKWIDHFNHTGANLALSSE